MNREAPSGRGDASRPSAGVSPVNSVDRQVGEQTIQRSGGVSLPGLLQSGVVFLRRQVSLAECLPASGEVRLHSGSLVLGRPP